MVSPKATETKYDVTNAFENTEETKQRENQHKEVVDEVVNVWQPDFETELAVIESIVEANMRNKILTHIAFVSNHACFDLIFLLS